MLDSDAVLIQLRDDLDFASCRIGKYICESFLEGLDKQAEILAGPMKNISVVLPISPRLVWIDSFKNAAFILIYKSIFREISTLSDSENSIENILSSHFVNKLAPYPFLITLSNLPQEEQIRLRQIQKKFKDALRKHAISPNDTKSSPAP